MNKESLYLVEVGQRIRSSRKSLGWSQEKLAEYVNIHPTYVSQIETGKVNLTINVLKAIADSLHVPMSELVGGEDNPDEYNVLNSDIRQTYYEIPDSMRDTFAEAIKGIIKAFHRK